MERQKSLNAPEKETPEGELSMDYLWDQAAEMFKTICGEAVLKSDVKTFDDVQKRIESVSKASYGMNEEVDKWVKAKSVGLKSLKCLKVLVGAASQACAFVPMPALAANITGAALCSVFSIPEAVKGYNDAIDQVFPKVSSALSQFKIYKSMDNVNTSLIRQIHLVLVCFVKLCAHVVKYRQGRKWDRVLRQIENILDKDKELSKAMDDFNKALQQNRDIEGTITLALVVDTRKDLARLLEGFIVFSKVAEDTQKGVQSLKEDADRIKMLGKIRDTLGVPWMVRLDTRTTQTCLNILGKCIAGTGSWIWTHNAYTTWTAPKDKDASHMLLVSGPPSSGKTLASALITKHLEELRERTYVAHYFFPPSIKKSDEDKSPVQSALKYMAFQIARVDVTMQKALGKACDEGFRNPPSLDNLWGSLKVGAPGSGATYYLVFDGLENLPDAQAKMLLKFISKLSGERVRVLASGTDDMFLNEPAVTNALRIEMMMHNVPDMRIFINEQLNARGMLQHAKPNSDQQRAREEVIDKLPLKAKGSYSMLQYGLDAVFRLLSTRTAFSELNEMLEQSMNSHEVAITNLQRSLTVEEINELNELLKWVLFNNDPLKLDELEAAMFLYSDTESLTTLQDIIKMKYSAVLKLEDTYVYGQDGVKDYLQRERDTSGRSKHPKGQATISMTIKIDNVDEELCGDFFWNLTHEVNRHNFDFNFKAASSNVLHSNQAAIAVDEFEAHHTIVKQTFRYLDQDPGYQTKEIGSFVVVWLPYHLGRLRQLEDEDKGSLKPAQQVEIGLKLYNLFKDNKVFRRHKASFEQVYWMVEEMGHIQKWLTDSAVVRKLDKKWRGEVQRAVHPTEGYLKVLVKMIVEGFLRERSWEVDNAYEWINQFMMVEQGQSPDADADDASSFNDSTSNTSEIDWDHVSTWCQEYLKLQDQDLDSLWYERLAEAAFSLESEVDTVISLYKCALGKENPSWLCHRGLGETWFRKGQTPNAIAEVDLALKEAEEKGATPGPEEKDIVDLHLLLGKYAGEEADVQKAAKHYLFACKSENSDQARKGQLGYLKARLSFPDAEGMTKLLQDTLAQEGGEGRMISVLKMIARDKDHAAIVLKMFTVAKGDPTLLERIVRAMQTATTNPAPDEDTSAEMYDDDRFAEDESRGVLLYYRGVAAYTYNVSPEGSEPISESLSLWAECRDHLSKIGGPNALVAYNAASMDLAKHYFQIMVDGKHLDHIDKLSELTGASSTPPFLGALYALLGATEKSRTVLRGEIKYALEILSDDMPQNDAVGFNLIYKTLMQHHDFENAAIALFLLGQPDLVTEALDFKTKDIMDDDAVNQQSMLGMVIKLAKETIRVTKVQVPDSSQQIQRIEAAIKHVDSLLAAAETKSEAEGAGNSETKRFEGHSEGGPTIPDSKTAYHHLHSRLSALQKIHAPQIDTSEFEWNWCCDGRTPDGKPCNRLAGFERVFYHCIYCSNRDFCEDCLKRLRDPKSSAEITACSAKHRWLRSPPLGGDMYVGLFAKSVQVPSAVKAVEDDESVLEIHLAEYGRGKEVTVEAWKQKLAKEWNITLGHEEGEGNQEGQ